MKNIIAILIVFVSTIQLFAQNTVGVISHNPDESMQGYNLIFPHNQSTVWLINNCGEIINQWNVGEGTRPGNSAYLQPNGDLVLCKRPADITTDPIWAGGGGATVEIRDWDNNLKWSFTQNDANQRLHHDIAIMPNGNILMIMWERKTETQALQAGRNPALITEGEIWSDKIIEVQPIGTNEFEIVWQWDAWDHLVQDFDNTQNNFGEIGNPRKININYDTNDGKADWLHANSIDFNPIFNQILISIPTFSEVWIIDHSTTTAQAASSSGGTSGLGGDLMYRWGNPQTYNAGTEDDRKLFYQHDAHYIDIGLTSAHPDFGKIAIFNNRVGQDYSTANIFSPTFDTYEWEYTFNGTTYGPTNFSWSYQAPTPQNMYSNILSSIQRLANGNTLIGVGRTGVGFELNSNNEIVWEFRNPMQGGNPVSQGTILETSDNMMFKINRYPWDYPAFEGLDLQTQGTIELNPDLSECQMWAVSTNNIYDNQLINLYPNPVKDQLNIELSNSVNSIKIIGTNGQIVYQNQQAPNQLNINTQNWASGIYLLKADSQAYRFIVQ